MSAHRQTTLEGSALVPTKSTEVMTGGEALVRSLLSYSVDTVFGIPGNHLYDFYDALHKAGSSVRVVTTRHEQGAGYMAFGYAQSTGKVGVCAVVPGAGLLNTTAALLAAYGCNAKVLCVTGQIPSAGIGKGIGYTHELPEQLAMIRSVTKWSARIERPAQAPEMVSRAFRELHTGRPRPVLLEMAIDVMAMECPVELQDPVASTPSLSCDPDVIERAAKLLGEARSPLILVGGGAIEAAEELRALAEMLQAPVVAHRQGRGVLSATHYLSQCYPAGHKLWADADVVVAVGTRLKYPLLYWGTNGLKIIRVDIDATEIDRVESPAVSIVADARRTLADLIPAVERHNVPRRSRQDEMEALKSEMQHEFRELEPQMSFLRVIREELPDDGIFVDDITQVGFASWFAFPVYRPRQFISSGYQGTLGHGFATALGVCIAHPHKKVIQVSGDGGFMYNVQELSTAVQNNLGIVAIVFRDNRFGNIYRDQKNRNGRRLIGCDLHNPDFVALAESFGAAGFRASTPEQLRQAIRRSFDCGGPAVIEVSVGEMPSPWRFIMMPRVRPSTH